MFTGIIKEIGVVAAAERSAGGVRLTVRAPKSAPLLAVDDSVAVSGVCQTVVGRSGEAFTVQAVEETLSKTTFGSIRQGTRVNLELALAVGERMGGHFVQGHVDGVGEVTRVERLEGSHLVTVRFPQEFARYVVPVGSIAVDGVSLTAARVAGNEVTVAVIPHTWENTTFGEYRPGSRVNMEFDMLGKYVEKLLKGEKGGGVTREQLRAWGYDV